MPRPLPRTNRTRRVPHPADGQELAAPRVGRSVRVRGRARSAGRAAARGAVRLGPSEPRRGDRRGECQSPPTPPPLLLPLSVSLLYTPFLPPLKRFDTPFLWGWGRGCKATDFFWGVLHSSSAKDAALNPPRCPPPHRPPSPMPVARVSCTPVVGRKLFAPQAVVVAALIIIIS